MLILYMQVKGNLKNSIDIESLRNDIGIKIKSMSCIAREMNISKAQLSRFLNGYSDNDAMIFRCVNWLDKKVSDYSK